MILVREALDKETKVKLRRRQLELQISYSSIIKIAVHSALSLIEIRWCNMANHSLVSSYLNYTNEPERHIWVKNFSLKLFHSFINEFLAMKGNSKLRTAYVNLLNLIDYCQISLCGFLSLENTPIYTEESQEQVLLMLLHTNESQITFFKKNLVIVRSSEPFIEIVDLRKIEIQQCDNHIRIDYHNKLVNNDRHCWVSDSFTLLIVN